MFTERLQILLGPDQRRRREAEVSRRSVSVARLVREAIAASYGGMSTDARVGAVGEIARLEDRFLSPEELGRLAEREHAETLERLLEAARP